MGASYSGLYKEGEVKHIIFLPICPPSYVLQGLSQRLNEVAAGHRRGFMLAIKKADEAREV